MRTTTILSAVLALMMAGGADAAVASKMCGYRHCDGYTVEFAMSEADRHYDATITKLTPSNDTVKVEFESKVTLENNANYDYIEFVNFQDGSLDDGCTAITGLTMPASVTNFEATVFAPCTALSDMWYNGLPPAGLNAAGIGSAVKLYYKGENKAAWLAANYAYPGNLLLWSADVPGLILYIH